MAKESRVPGSYKSTATTQDFKRPYQKTSVVENNNYPPATGVDMALSDRRVLDEDYDYTTTEYPGRMLANAELKKAEAQHKVHPPLTK